MESKVGPRGTSAPAGILYIPLVIVRTENLVE
jgi:hypothetical protein